MSRRVLWQVIDIMLCGVDSSECGWSAAGSVLLSESMSE